MLLIGSHALKDHCERSSLNPQFRQPADIDLILLPEHLSNFIYSYSIIEIIPRAGGKYICRTGTRDPIIELEMAYDGTTAKELLELEGALTFVDKGFQTPIASLEACLALKLSHRYKKNSPHFRKTRNDCKLINILMGGGLLQECKYEDRLSEPYLEWFKNREKETLNYKHPNLNVKKDEFFADQYEFDHDSLHMAIAIGEKPAYEYFKDDESEVKCSEFKWDKADKMIKVRAAYEEAAVLALERCLIPNNFKPDPDKVFEFALIKVCTSITSGWFREWCWYHYDEILEQYRNLSNASFSYVDGFHEGVANGIVKRNPNFPGEQNGN